MVAVKDNRDAMGGMMIWGMSLPEYREGDSVWPGRPVADVIESGRMEMRAKVDENDRANLTEGQPSAVEVDAIPGEKFPAKVGRALGARQPRRLLRVRRRHPPVRRDLPVRSIRTRG